MQHAKFWAIALASFLTVFPTLNQEATAQPKQRGVDLRGNWTEKSRVFARSGKVGCQSTPREGSRKLTITSHKGSSITIPSFRYWSDLGKSGSYGATTAKVSGRTVSFTIKGGGFTARYKGTINKGANKITGRVVCTYSSGKTADVPFTLTRLGTPTRPGLG